ncbi:hypothetical protein [Actinoplanes sp. TFC3]|uniref:hypothetical protein n=1 Tax=Actinoplanes sp. TFC3 TaxID=1710355 RepID=UPI001379CE1E|nr:hypothetical protein [Actinoplanes sp. TFC3]
MATREQSTCQDLRVAVVMTGGVSLAVWISGATTELYDLAMARRANVASGSSRSA